MDFVFYSVLVAAMVCTVVMNEEIVPELLSLASDRNGKTDDNDGHSEGGVAAADAAMLEQEEQDGYIADNENSEWNLFGRTLPKNEVIFICQVVILYIVILTCIVNLSLKNGDSNLWTALLSSSLGIMLPQPTISKRRQ